MITVEYRIDNTFEAPTKEEWEKYLGGSSLFNNMLINSDGFKVAEDIMTELLFNQGIREYIRVHNNKVGVLNISYVLSRHYFDKGIPDDQWYISPGKKGSSIEYMPNFQEADWLVHYWFSYHCEAVYYKLFSIWDSVVGFINEYYQMGYKDDYRFRINVMKELKKNRSDIENLMKSILEEKIYKDANMYRTNIVHGTPPSEVSGFIRLERDVDSEAPDRDENGKIKTDKKGIVMMKKVKNKMCISGCAGEYTKAKTIMDNIDEFCLFTGEKIEQIMTLIKEDQFYLKR